MNPSSFSIYSFLYFIFENINKIRNSNKSWKNTSKRIHFGMMNTRNKTKTRSPDYALLPNPAPLPLPGDAAPWGPRAGIPRDSEPRTLAGKTALRIRQDIIRNRLKPGERLKNETLTEMYDVGTSPLREALFQVAGDGLVRFEDHKGFIVSPLDIAEMWDVSSLRAYLEINAIQRSIALGGEDWETAVLTAEHRLARAQERLLHTSKEDLQAAEDEWELRHREFHYALCSACGSPWLLHFFDALYDQLERYRRHFWHYKDRAQGADDQHNQIKDSALARDSGKVVMLLTEHFRQQAELSAKSQQPAMKPDSAEGKRSAPKRKRG